MGLDMYLSRKVWIGANYEHNKITGKINITRDGVPVKINLDKVTEITESCGYWRKANQIHRWFVDNVQDGNDDCKQYYVSEEKLKELLDICLQIKENPTLAENLLPTSQGFFFGSDEYDEYYMDDIDNTIDILSTILNDIEINHKDDVKLRGSIYYQSSW